MAASKIVGATALLGVHAARSVYGRWRRLSAEPRARLEPLAEEVKSRALDLRGHADPAAADTAGRELAEANGRLADALVDSAASDPEISEDEVRALRDDLARELERLASADIRASRGPGTASPRQGAAADDAG